MMSRILLLLLIYWHLPTLQADMNDAVNCGFVESHPSRPGVYREPAAIFKSLDQHYYVITPTNVFKQNCQFYFKDGLNERFFSAQKLLDNKSIYPPPHGPDYVVHEISIDDLDDELREVIERCAISEEQFVEPKLGMAVTIHGQSHRNSIKGAQHRGVIASTEDKTYEFDSVGPHPYHLVLPASKDCPSTSWVTSNDPVDGIENPVLGLMLDHVLYKTGDCFLDVKGIRFLVKTDVNDIVALVMNQSPSRSSACVFLRNLESTDRFVENWVPAGLIAGTHEFEIWKIQKGKLHGDRSSKFGFPGCLLKDGEKLYLIIDPSNYELLNNDSILCAVKKGAKQEVKLGDYFQLSKDKPPIDIDGVFAAIPCIQSEDGYQFLLSNAYSLKSSAQSEEPDFIYGRSIPNNLLQKHVEEAVVYASMQQSLAANPGPDSIIYYDSGIYPAALFSDSNGNERFFGLLGFNVRTQEPTIYTVPELRAFLTK